MKATMTTPAPAPAPLPRADVEAIDAALDAADRRGAPGSSPTLSAVATPQEAPEVDLSGAPVLRPLKTLRARQRVTLWKSMMSMNDRLGGEAAEDGTVAISVDDLDVIADIEELLENFAVDPQAYVSWVTEEGGGPDPDARVLALFSRYAEQLGESAPSTT